MKTCASCWTSAPRSRGPPNEFRWRAGTIRREALPLDGDGALAPLIDAVRNARVVLIGEASHGTHEFYRTRAELTKALIRDHGFDIVAVEADWPDAYRINRWVRGASQESGPEAALDDFTRFPRWMWRNRDVVAFVQWLHDENAARPEGERTGSRPRPCSSSVATTSP